MKMCANAVKLSVVAIGCILGAADAHARAVPARTITFDGGNCTAKFVRSGSGIVHETKRECTGDQNPWVDEDVVIHFRPLNGKPNPECDPAGLVTTFVWSNTDPVLEDYLPIGDQYNVCVYLEDPVTDSGTILASDVDGTTTDAVPLAGDYQICVRGTWVNRGLETFDAEYATTDNWVTHTNGLAGFGENLGDVTVNGQFVNWGSYSTQHRYCTTVTLEEGDTVTLAVFDGENGIPNVGWYADNVGSLSYTMRYLGM